MEKMGETNRFKKSYVKEAEKNIRLLKEKKRKDGKSENQVNNTSKMKFDFVITTSQIRKLLSILNDIYSYVVSIPSDLEDEKKENAEILKEKMQYFKMRCIYEAGRDEYTDTRKTSGVHDFVERTQLVNYLNAFDEITNPQELREAFIWIFHYMESLVAYHRFLGGKDSER